MGYFFKESKYSIKPDTNKSLKLDLAEDVDNPLFKYCKHSEFKPENGPRCDSPSISNTAMNTSYMTKNSAHESNEPRSSHNFFKKHSPMKLNKSKKINPFAGLRSNIL